MIFVTVGTQIPFDRFIRIVDEVAADITEEIVVQAFPDKYRPRNIKLVDFLAPDEFGRLFSRARLIVAHAGMGTILSAMEQGKPIIVMPRIAALGEHRNEHQLATARRMASLGYVYLAEDAATLRQLMLRPGLPALHTLGPTASAQLLDTLRSAIG